MSSFSVCQFAAVLCTFRGLREPPFATNAAGTRQYCQHRNRLSRAFGFRYIPDHGGVSMRVLLSTIGSRGDVQPLVALALHLKSLGHGVRLCVPPDFRQWIEGFGI